MNRGVVFMTPTQIKKAIKESEMMLRDNQYNERLVNMLQNKINELKAQLPKTEIKKGSNKKPTKTKVTKDKYCLECGESVPVKARKCEYCGSKELDIMEIEGEEE
jgi:ribosomal protein L40E